MRVRPESVTHLVVKLFNVKSKFDYIDKNSFMKPEERPYLFHEALCLRYFCIAELNMIW